MDEMSKAERQIEANHSRRMANQHRALVRAERMEAKALPMVGELCREGKTVYYFAPIRGRYFESAHQYDVCAYIIRNQYVRA